MLIAALLAAALAHAQSPFTIQPFAGVPRTVGDNGPAVSAILWSPHGVMSDRSGNVYIVDTADNLLRRVSPAGIITTVTDQLQFPWRTALGSTGDIYVADAANNRILKISPAGAVTTFAGTGVAGNDGDGGAASAAALNSPRDVAADAAGNLFILDSGNNRIRKVTPDRRIVAYAGTGLPGLFGDGGAAVNARLSFPYGIALDTAGDLFIADTFNQRIRVVTPDGAISTVQAGLNYPSGMAADSSGNLYFADSGNNVVRKLTQPLAANAMTVVAGTGVAGFSGDGSQAAAAMLNQPQDVALDAQGNLLIADSGNNRIRAVSPQGLIQTVAGSDRGSGDGAPALNARLFQPSGVVVDRSGNVYVADSGNNRIRRISADGLIGTAVSGLNNPNGLAFDNSGALYIADTDNNVVRKLVGGSVTMVVGTGAPGNTGDEGPASLAHLYHPNAIAFDAAGAMYIADSGNNRVRKVSPDGIIHNVAGEPKQGLPGYAGDGGPAASALLSYPRSLAVDRNGNLFIADFFNDRIREVAAGSGIITTVAGTGVRGGSGENVPATQAQLALPAGIAFDGSGNLLIADSLNNRIRLLTSSGLLRTIAGSGGPGDSGDGGPAPSAVLASPRDIAVDAQGSIYFTDQDNNRVRKLAAGSVISAVVNAATGLPGGVAPGEIVAIFGTNLGGSRVLFDGVAAPLLYSSNNQVNAIVPYEVAGSTSTHLVIESKGGLTVPVQDAAPGVFAVANQNGARNTISTPASLGEVVVLYATGEGQTNPPGVTGRIAAGTLPAPVLPLTVQIGGQAAVILYAGAAPQTEGVLQVNARLPDGIAPGDALPVVLSVGPFTAPPLTIAVR